MQKFIQQYKKQHTNTRNQWSYNTQEDLIILTQKKLEKMILNIIFED